MDRSGGSYLDWIYRRLCSLIRWKCLSSTKSSRTGHRDGGGGSRNALPYKLCRLPSGSPTTRHPGFSADFAHDSDRSEFGRSLGFGGTGNSHIAWRVPCSALVCLRAIRPLAFPWLPFYSDRRWADSRLRQRLEAP